MEGAAASFGAETTLRCLGWLVLSVWVGWSGLSVFSQNPPVGLLRLDKPGPGVAALYTMDFGGSVMAVLSFYF